MISGTRRRRMAVPAALRTSVCVLLHPLPLDRKNGRTWGPGTRAWDLLGRPFLDLTRKPVLGLVWQHAFIAVTLTAVRLSALAPASPAVSSSQVLCWKLSRLLASEWLWLPIELAAVAQCLRASVRIPTSSTGRLNLQLALSLGSTAARWAEGQRHTAINPSYRAYLLLPLPLSSLCLL